VTRDVELGAANGKRTNVTDLRDQLVAEGETEIAEAGGIALLIPKKICMLKSQLG